MPAPPPAHALCDCSSNPNLEVKNDLNTNLDSCPLDSYVLCYCTAISFAIPLIWASKLTVMSWMLCNHASFVNLCTLSLRGMLYLCTCHSVYNSVYASVGQCCVCAGIRFVCLVERSEACDSTLTAHTHVLYTCTQGETIVGTAFVVLGKLHAFCTPTPNMICERIK